MPADASKSRCRDLALALRLPRCTFAQPVPAAARLLAQLVAPKRDDGQQFTLSFWVRAPPPPHNARYAALGSRRTAAAPPIAVDGSVVAAA